MKRTATPRRTNRTPSPTQEKALAALLGGSSVTEAAQAAGVDRSTLHRWLREDWAFQAALNRGQRELQEAVKAQLLELAGKAAQTVAEAVQSGDVRTSLALLKGLGLLKGRLERPGPDNPDTLKRDAEASEHDAVSRRRLSAWAASNV